MHMHEMVTRPLKSKAIQDKICLGGEESKRKKKDGNIYPCEEVDDANTHDPDVARAN